MQQLLNRGGGNCARMRASTLAEKNSVMLAPGVVSLDDARSFPRLLRSLCPMHA